MTVRLYTGALMLWAGMAHGAAVVASMDDIQYWVGTGPNRAAIIIDWQDQKNLPGQSYGQALVWGYRWEGTTSPTGYDALVAIDASDPRLQICFTTFSSTGSQPFFFGASYDLDADGGIVQFDPSTEQGSSSDPSDHFAEGVMIKGSWGYLLGASVVNAVPSQWTLSRTGAGGRTLTNGAWDAWVFSTDLVDATVPNPVSGAPALPVPEPSAFWVAAASLGFCWAWRRR